MSRAKDSGARQAAQGATVLTPITASSASARQVNRSIVLNLIRTNEPVSRADLARLMGVVRSTITGIVDDLVASGIVVEELGTLEGRGRTPMHLRLNDSNQLVAGVHVRAGVTVVATAGLRASMVQQAEFQTPSSPQALVEAIGRALRSILSSSTRPKTTRPAQVAVALPGLVDYRAGTVLWVPTLPSYSDFPLADALSAELRVPVIIDNDCNLGALSEAWRRGNSPQARNMVFLNIGDHGVGAGVVLNNGVYRGHDSRFVAEFGHMTIDTNGPKCVCGRRGCWELLVSNAAIWRRYAPRRAFSSQGFRKLLDDAAAGEPRALHVLRETAEYLRAGIANIVSILNPSEIVLSGALLKCWHVISPRLAAKPVLSFGNVLVQSCVDQRGCGVENPAQDGILPHLFSKRVLVRPAQQPEEDSLLHGAFCAALDRFFSQPQFGWGQRDERG